MNILSMLKFNAEAHVYGSVKALYLVKTLTEIKADFSYQLCFMLVIEVLVVNTISLLLLAFPQESPLFMDSSS